MTTEDDECVKAMWMGVNRIFGRNDGRTNYVRTNYVKTAAAPSNSNHFHTVRQNNCIVALANST